MSQHIAGHALTWCIDNLGYLAADLKDWSAGDLKELHLKEAEVNGYLKD